MTYDWEKLNQLFHQALGYAPGEREAFVERACSGDVELRDEALGLLAAHEEDEDFMETPLIRANLAGQFGDWQSSIVGALENREPAAVQTRPPDYLINQVLDGKYRIEERRGQGGMGAVYRATHEGTGRRVAIKIIAPEFMANPEFVERFKREAKAAGMLNHPHVVNVTDFGLATQAGWPRVAYLVMEYLEGLTLADLTKEKRGLPLEEVVSITEQICRAIDEAHRAGILHRDLKPENIWLEPLPHGGYHVKVLDFGLAKLRDIGPDETKSASDRASSKPSPASALPNRTRLLSDEEAQTLRRAFSTPQNEASVSAGTAPAEMQDEEFERAPTRPTIGQLDTRTAPHWFSRAGMVLGTPTYMSPEQCRGERLDSASDIYSLGVIAYQMLAGEAPFAGTTAELLAKHKELAPPSLMQRRPGLPEAVADVLTSTLSKERTGRPATAGAFACALRLAAGGERAIRREASAIYQKHRWLFLKTAARVHAPVITLGLLLLLSAALLPVMPPALSPFVFGLLWLIVLFLSFYGNAATTAACTLIVEGLTGRGHTSVEAGSIRPVEAEAGRVRPSVRRESGLLIRGVASGAGDAVRSALSLSRDGWRAYFDSLLLIPLVVVEKLRGRDALRRAKTLGRHVRRLAADIRALHLAAVLFSVLAYQVLLICWGIVLDALSHWTPPYVRVDNLIIMLLVMAALFGLLIIMQVRTGIEHAVLYLRARAISGERVSNTSEPLASGALIQSDTNWPERPRLPHGRAIALATLCIVAASGWQFFKQAVITSSVEEGSVNLVKAFNASGVPVPVWSRWGRPDVGELMRWPTPIVELLIAKGADVNARVSLDRWWMPPYKTNVTTTPLMSALTVNSANSARVLLEHDADVHAQDSQGRTPLMVAAIYCPEAIDLLLQHGAGINERTGKGTPLLNAARYRGIYDDETERTQAGLNARDDALGLLLKRGANPFDLDEEGRTALMVISMETRPDRIILPMAETLLNAGADINARDPSGRTPLMYAVRHKQRATVAFLLSHGADASIKDMSGATALEIAKQLGFDDIARMLPATNAGNTWEPMPPTPSDTNK